MSAIGGLFHLNLSVRDVRRSAAWYRELLGLEQVFEVDTGVEGWTKIGLYHPASQLRLNFTQHRAGATEPFSELRIGLDHLAFRVPGGSAALREWLARLDQLGVEHSAIKKAAVGQVITFRDPDNIQLELYAASE